MSEPQQVLCASCSQCTCSRPAEAANDTRSADCATQAPDEKANEPKVNDSDSVKATEALKEARKRVQNTRSAERSRARKIPIPDEIMDSMCNGPPGLFFVEYPSHCGLKCANYDMETYGKSFPDLATAMGKLRNIAKDRNRDWDYIFIGYPYPDEEPQTKLSETESFMKIMTLQLAKRISSPDAPEWRDSSKVVSYVIGELDFCVYADLVVRNLKEYLGKNTTAELMIIFGGMRGLQKDKREVQKMLELLRALCTVMGSFGSRLKIVVTYNIVNRLWDEFREYISTPEDSELGSVCSAHKFEDGDCYYLVGSSEWKKAKPRLLESQ